MKNDFDELLDIVYKTFFKIYAEDYSDKVTKIASNMFKPKDKITELKTCLSDIAEYEDILNEYKKAIQDFITQLEKTKEESKIKNIQLQYTEIIDDTDKYTDYMTPNRKIVRVWK